MEGLDHDLMPPERNVTADMQALQQQQEMAFERFLRMVHAYPAGHVAKSIIRAELVFIKNEQTRFVKGFSQSAKQGLAARSFRFPINLFLIACKTRAAEDFMHDFLFDLEWKWKANRLQWKGAA